MELIKGDCLNELTKLKDNSVDLVLVDLPYGQTANDWDIPIDLTKMWELLKKKSKDNTAFLFLTTTKYGYKLIQSNERWFRYDLVWEKTKPVGFINANRMPLRNHELIYVFYKKLPTYNPQKTIPLKHPITRTFKHELNGNYGKIKQNFTKTYEFENPKSTIKFANPNNKTKHSTQKPVDLLEYLIKTYSNENDTILDFTMGSGSTGVACKNINRNFIGIELNDDFFKVATDRILGNVNDP